LATASTTTAPGPRRRARRWASGFRQRETWVAFAFLSPWIVGFIVFTAGPMVASGYLSFTDYSIISPTHGVGWDNYRELIHDPKVRTGLRNTLVYTAMAVPSHIIFALFLAMLLARVGRFAGFFRTVFYLPVLTPSVAVGILYFLIFNGTYGLINQALDLIHIKGPFWQTDPAWVKPSLVIMHLWSVGASVVILLAALLGVPQHLYEASKMDGAGWWRRFRDVTLPMISPAVFFLVVINTINGLQTFDEVYTAFFNQNSPFGTDASLFYVIYLFQ
jgi:multiple sugar transport system permease protein